MTATKNYKLVTIIIIFVECLTNFTTFAWAVYFGGSLSRKTFLNFKCGGILTTNFRHVKKILNRFYPILEQHFPTWTIFPFSHAGCNDLCEDDEDEDTSSPRKKTTIEEQWEKNQGFELTSVEQETYEKYFYGTEHWNYFTNDEDLGPVILSIKQETLNGRDQFRWVK